MNPVALLNSATMGKPSRLAPMVLWTMIEYLLRGVPYGILLVVIDVFFQALTDQTIDYKRAAIAWGGLFLSLVALFFVNRKSYFSSFKDSYEICALGRLSMAEHLRKLSMSFYDRRDPGDIGAYLVNDYANVENLISHIVPQLAGGLTMPLMLLVSLSFFSWKLALTAAVVIPLAWPLAFVSMRIIEYTGRRHQKVRVEVGSRIIEYIQGMRLIKAFNLGGTRFSRLDDSFRRLKRASIILEGGSGPTMVMASFVLNTGFAIVVLYGLMLLIEREISIPVYLMFVILSPRIYEPLLHSMMFLGELNYMKLGVERIEELRRTEPLPNGSIRSGLASFDIELKGVTFRYNDSNTLNGVNLKIPNGSFTALVGPSGSGKTTVTRLIARFRDVDEGQVLIGGKDVRSLDTDYLLSLISIVFQDVYLFRDTLFNNIRMGRPDATFEEVREAAREARCNFIDELPDGYDTIVGEGGCTLSGGEKQRISIARAILKDAPIVLLDEATASLDPENEAFIQHAIDDLVQGKTIIVIAHRLPTVAAADNIVVLDSGRVVEQGRHETLFSQTGLYHRLWQEQQRIKDWRFIPHSPEGADRIRP